MSSFVVIVVCFVGGGLLAMLVAELLHHRAERAGQTRLRVRFLAAVCLRCGQSFGSVAAMREHARFCAKPPEPRVIREARKIVDGGPR